MWVDNCAEMVPDLDWPSATESKGSDVDRDRAPESKGIAVDWDAANGSDMDWDTNADVDWDTAAESKGIAVDWDSATESKELMSTAHCKNYTVKIIFEWLPQFHGSLNWGVLWREFTTG